MGMEMFGSAHVGIEGHGLDRPGKGSRVAWIVAGALAAAVTLAVVVWEVLDRTEDSDAERTGEEPAPPRKWWSVS